MLKRTKRISALKEGMLAGAFVFGLVLAGVSLVGIGNNAVADLTVTGPRDCDSNSVMHCGALSTSELKTKYDANAPGDIPAIYNHFGISSADISGLSTKAEVGVVKADGTVWIGDKLIGVNAHTAGRNRTTNSVAIANSKAYKRPPSDSFATSSTTIKVFVGYKNGVPAWGVITSCGNPLIWDSPAVSVEKQVRKNASDSWHEEVTVENGSEAEFRIQLKETTGVVDAQDVVVRDLLPKGLELTAGSVTVNGSNANFANGEISVGKVAKGSTVDILFRVKASLLDRSCGAMPIDNTAMVSGLNIAAQQNSATVIVSKKCEEPKPEPKPVEPKPVEPKPEEKPSSVTCDSLSASRTSLYRGEKSELNVKASRVNAEITGHIFRVNDVSVQNSTRDTYTYEAVSPGSYTITATVKSTLGEKTSAACRVVITVAEKPSVAPTYACESFTLDKTTAKTGESVRTTTRIVARDGAVFKMARVRHGDETRPSDSFSTNAVSGGIITTDHTYTKAGDYTARVSLEFEVDGATKTVDDPKCAAPIKVSATEVKAAVTPPAPTSTTTPTPQPTATTLPATGSGGFMGLFSGLTIAGAAAHRSRTLRKIVRK